MDAKAVYIFLHLSISSLDRISLLALSNGIAVCPLPLRPAINEKNQKKIRILKANLGQLLQVSSRLSDMASRKIRSHQENKRIRGL